VAAANGGRLSTDNEKSITRRSHSTQLALTPGKSPPRLGRKPAQDTSFLCSPKKLTLLYCHFGHYENWLVN